MATWIELVKEPRNGSFESFTETLGLPVNMFKHCINFLINWLEQAEGLVDVGGR